MYQNTNYLEGVSIFSGLYNGTFLTIAVGVAVIFVIWVFLYDKGK